jgi:hypothetical protein
MDDAMKLANHAYPISTANAWLIHARVLHERKLPRRNRFVYPVFCLRVNIQALPELNHWWMRINRSGLLSVHERDHGPRDGSALFPWICQKLEEAGLPTDGEIWLQTFPRLLGYVFNPVSFWFCHDRSGALVALLAEVNNTFGEHHSYLLAAPDRGHITESTPLQCLKTFHVSPFLKPVGHYEFRVREGQGTSFIAIDYFDQNNQKVLHTSIGGRLAPASRRAVLAAMARQPFMTFSVIARIHWQALKLWLARVPFFGARAPADSDTTVSSTGKPTP